MNKEDFLSKCDSLIDDVANEMKDKARHYLKSGALPDDYPDNYILPKCAVTAAIHDCNNAYEPMKPEHKSIVENLKHF